MQPTALLTSAELMDPDRVARMLERTGIAVRQCPWNDEAMDLVVRDRFEVIVIGYPVTGTPLPSFLGAVRAAGSASRRAGVILIAQPGRERMAGDYLGRGANRVVAAVESPTALEVAVHALLTVAPRVPLRAPTRIVAILDKRPLRAFCQTENVSTTGMLLRGAAHYPLGTTFDFELAVPGESTPICGSACVLRRTNPVVERVHGLGTRFVSFRGADRSRLEGLVGRALAS